MKTIKLHITSKKWIRILAFLMLNSSFLIGAAQEPAWGTQAKSDSLDIREKRAKERFKEAVDELLITDFAKTHLTANALVKTCPFLDYPALNPALGDYLKRFEDETGSTIIIRAYIDAGYFNPWIAAFGTTQRTRKLYEIARAKPAHAVIDIVYTPINVVKYKVQGYNITIKDSVRTAQFNAIFTEADFEKMRTTLQQEMGTSITAIDTANFNTAIIKALEAMKGEPESMKDPGYKVVFRQGEAKGFDSYKYTALRNTYKTDNQGNPIPWLSADANQPVNLKGYYEVKDKDAAKNYPIQIMVDNQPTGNPTIQDTTITQSLSPSGTAKESTITVGYERTNRFNKTVTTVAGAIGLATYEEQECNVVIVGDIDEVELQTYLNNVYGQAIAKWTVTKITNFDYSYPSELNTEKSALSNYSSDMNAVIKAFKKQHKVENNTYYIFLAPKLSGSTAGFMPFKQQFGFVEKNTSNVNRTIAHELGHGAFRLKHTFSTEGTYIATQGATDNLMDYSNGEKLYKYQWDYVHDPEGMVFTWADEEEETMEKGLTIDFTVTAKFVDFDKTKHSAFVEKYTAAYNNYNKNNDKPSETLLNQYLYININQKKYRTNSVATIFGRDHVKAYIGRFHNVFEIDDYALLTILGHSDYVFLDIYGSKPIEQCVRGESVGFNNKKLDYKWELYRILKDHGINQNDLVAIDGIVYNANEIGNYIWGMALFYHGCFPNPNYIAEKGTRNRNDEPWEQRAITRGKEKADKISFTEKAGKICLTEEDKDTILRKRLDFRWLYSLEDKSWRELTPFTDLK